MSRLEIPVFGNTTDFRAELAKAGIVADDTSKKIAGSFRMAGAAAAEESAKIGRSVEQQSVAAGRAAAAFTEMSAKITTAQRNAGKAAAAAASAVGASVDEQRAAYTRAIASQAEYESAVKRSADEQVAAAQRAKVAAAEQAAAVRKSADESVAAAESSQKRMSTLGKFTLGGGVGVAAVSVKGAIDLQRQMEQIHTQAGASQAEVTKMTTAVMNMAPGLATGPAALADSLYHVESAGFRGAQALNIMSTAAKESKISGADLTDTTTALTASVFSGIKGAQNFSQAMGLLNATVGAGDMKFQDLNEAFAGPMLATVKGYGLSLKDVGAALATFGDLNIRGADAATQLRMAVQYMAKPAATAGPLLKKLGLNTHSFADAMANGGLMPALQLLHERMDKVGVKGNQMAQVIGALFTKKGASGIDILENSLGKLGTKYTAVGAGASKQNEAWNSTQKTLAFQMDQLKATVQALADKFGMFLIPKLQAAGNAVKDVIAWFGKHTTAAQVLAGVIGGVLATAVSVFAYTKAVAFVKATGDMIGGIGRLAGGIASAVPSILAKFGLISTGAASTATSVEASNAAAAGSFGAMGAEAAAGVAGVEADSAGMAAAVEANDTAIVTANEAAGASFTALIPIIGAAAAAIAGYNALATNFAAQGTAAVGGLQKSSGNALNKGQLKGLLASTGAIGTTGKHGAWPWTPDNISLINASDKALKQFAGSGNQALLDGIIARAEKLKKVWPGDASALNTLIGVMNKAKHEGAANLPPGMGAQGIPPAIGGWSKGNVPVPTSGSNAQRIAGALAQQGFSKVAIAGILGNFAQETGGGTLSGINTRDTGTGASGMGGMGIAQWTASRRIQEQDYATIHHESATSLPAQIGYLIQELRGGYHNAFKAIQGASSPQQAAQLFNQLFEGGTDPSGIREKAAQQAMGMLSRGGGAGGLSNAGLNALLDSGKKQPKQKPLGIPQGVENMLHLAQQLEGAPYNNQAGHAAAYNETIAQIKKFGTDCSGLVSVLLKEGITGIKSAQNTEGLPTNAGLSKGTGRYVTVYDRPGPITPNSHTLIDILGHYFESGGNKKYNPSGGVSELSKAQAYGELSGGGFVAFHPTNLNSPVRGGSTASVLGNNTAAGVAAFLQAVTKALVTAANSMLQKLGNAVQTGTLKTLSNALGLSSGHTVSLTGKSGQLGLSTVTAGTALHSAIEQLGPNASISQINKATTGLAQQGTAGSQQDRAFQSEVSNLIANGQAKLAQQLVAAHKQAMQALGQEEYAQQTLKDGEYLAQQATALKDQTTMIANAQAQQLTIAKAVQQKTDDAAAAMVQSMKDASQTMTDQMAGIAQAIKDNSAVAADTNNAIVDAINDQTQVQVDKIGERGLYGLNLVAQQLTVQLDVTKAFWNQQIDASQKQLDQLQAQADAAESAAQVNLDQVTALQNVRVAQAQNNLDTVTIAQNQRIASAQAHADSVQLHVDSSLIGPAQIAVDMNATASKSTQDVMSAALKKATGQGDLQIGVADRKLTEVTDSAASIIQGATSAYTSVQSAAATAIQSATDSVATTTGYYNGAIAAAAAAVTGTQGSAAAAEAPLSGAVAVTSATASTQFAGSGLIVNMYGIPVQSATDVAGALDWVARNNLFVGT